MVTIKLKDRVVPLSYSVWEMKQLQEDIAPAQIAIAMMTGRNPDDEKDTSLLGGKDQLKTLCTAIRILGNAGLEIAGEVPDLTDKRVGRSINPRNLWDYVNACLNAMAEGMASEIPAKEDDGPVDVVLEEINKKKDPGS